MPNQVVDQQRPPAYSQTFGHELPQSQRVEMVREETRPWADHAEIVVQPFETLLMQFAPDLNIDEIADPFGGPAAGYIQALDLIEAGCRGLLAGFKSEFKAARSD